MSVGLVLLIINGRGITVNDRGSGDAVGKCRGYGRGVSRNASAAGPSGGFICGSSSEVAGHEEVGSPGCPWVVDALPGQRINFTLMDFFQRHRTTASGDDNHGLQQPGKTSIRHFSGHSPRTYPPDSSPPRQFPSPLRTFSLTCYSENLKFCTVNTRFML